MDEARTESILRLIAPPEVVAWVASLRLERAVDDVVRLPPQPKLSMMARVVAPLRIAGELRGYLWVIDAEQSLSAPELKIVAETAQSATLVLDRERLLEDLEAGGVANCCWICYPTARTSARQPPRHLRTWKAALLGQPKPWYCGYRPARGPNAMTLP